jgi:hypothetical protein
LGGKKEKKGFPTHRTPKYRHPSCTLDSASNNSFSMQECTIMIRKISSGKYRLYSRKLDPKRGKRRNLGTFDSREAAEKHERAVQYFKHH